MKICLIILSIIGLLKLVSLFLNIVILSIKNNISKVENNELVKHYHETRRNICCGICDWVYLIPTIRTTISNEYFEIEIDIFFFYIFIDYSIIDIDNDES